MNNYNILRIPNITNSLMLLLNYLQQAFSEDMTGGVLKHNISGYQCPAEHDNNHIISKFEVANNFTCELIQSSLTKQGLIIRKEDCTDIKIINVLCAPFSKISTMCDIIILENPNIVNFLQNNITNLRQVFDVVNSTIARKIANLCDFPSFVPHINKNITETIDIYKNKTLDTTQEDVIAHNQAGLMLIFGVFFAAVFSVFTVMQCVKNYQKISEHETNENVKENNCLKICILDVCKNLWTNLHGNNHEEDSALLMVNTDTTIIGSNTLEDNNSL